MSAGRDPYGPIEGELVDAAGVRFRDLRKTLTPRYGRVWLEIALGHLALALALGATALATSVPAMLLAAIPGALAVGYAMAFIQLYFHEAAHFLLAPKRAWNDLLANAFIGMWIGQDIKRYRPIHFAHHRDLGTAEDTERTYFEALTVRFIVEALFGVRVVRVLALRRRALRDAAPSQPRTKPAPAGSRWPLLLGLTVHGAIVLGLLASQRWAALFAWLAGIGTVYPLLTSLRQLLEHRALPNADGVTPPYAAAHRLFGAGPFASTFGAAGFNRHLLHHMEPQLSCTRLGELEAYVLRTERARWLAEHRTSYARAFTSLLTRPRGEVSAPARS